MGEKFSSRLKIAKAVHLCTTLAPPALIQAVFKASKNVLVNLDFVVIRELGRLVELSAGMPHAAVEDPE
jgi:hypothetical protein